MAVSSQFGGMILLEPGNRILGEVVADRLARGAEEKKSDMVDVLLCDFDDVKYRVHSEKESPDLLKISVALPCYSAVKDHGAEAVLKKDYGDWIVDTEDSYDFTIAVDCAASGLDNAAVQKKVENLKTNVLGGVFRHYFEALQAGKSLDKFQFSQRADTDVYISQSSDRVTIVFSLLFADRVDRAIARVFLTEFAETRRRMGNAPPVQYGMSPPNELAEFGITEPSNDDRHVGFISFALLKRHVDPKRIDTAVSMMHQFRNYVQYHIKCSKSYFHQRMRARVVSLLKVLNRAKNEDKIEKSMKTMSGKTFSRR